MYKHILISTDGSEVAQKGVDHGLSLAKSLGAKVTIITVTEPFPFHASAAAAGWVPIPEDISGYEEGQKKAAEKLLASMQQSAEKLGVNASVVHVPDARPADLQLGTATRSGLWDPAPLRR